MLYCLLPRKILEKKNKQFFQNMRKVQTPPIVSGFCIQVEPPNKGRYGANDFVPCKEVVPISEGHLSEVPL